MTNPRRSPDTPFVEPTRLAQARLIVFLPLPPAALQATASIAQERYAAAIKLTLAAGCVSTILAITWMVVEWMLDRRLRSLDGKDRLGQGMGQLELADSD